MIELAQYKIWGIAFMYIGSPFIGYHAVAGVLCGTLIALMLNRWGTMKGDGI